MFRIFFIFVCLILVKVFPNPTTEAIFITHATEQFFEVRITDVSGKQILQTPHQKQQPLNVQSLTSSMLMNCMLPFLKTALI